MRRANMSSVSHAGNKYLDWIPGISLQHLIKSLEGFFRRPEITKRARIWHGNFSYPLIPDTAIKSFHYMSPATSIDAGDCYVCIFDDEQYRGNYQVIGPGEKAQVSQCASVVISDRKIPVESVRRNGQPPGGFWELDGPMYVMQFSRAYRYV
ncbi:hypothetical protein [Desulfoscipio geothermicus]|uniref:Uncharacterized protein n=1 Tax=Desulfoscipio geothermicus DSM 3669 TaxID=1121426 RepID=A0A1I6CN74_9FIRM|nr:hypothetical protein [Desulfoscipio geothermicus]SFQ94622.1 hypothetical protein SAMN05660706_10115 [Desulfoscipio geothermicus DSM 3669]